MLTGTQKQILGNVKARETASEILLLAGEEASSMSLEHRQRFYKYLRDAALEIVPLPKQNGPALEPMSDAESRRFGKTLMPFGKYADESIDNVPTSYLDWLATSDDAIFIKQLNRYLASPRILAEVKD